MPADKPDATTESDVQAVAENAFDEKSEALETCKV
jgi:hypothetical protein